MSLKEKAGELSNALHTMVLTLESCPEEDARWFAKRLKRCVEEYDDAVFNKKSRELAADALLGMSDLTDEIATCVFKGGLFINPKKEFPFYEYSELKTIFREIDHKEESL